MESIRSESASPLPVIPSPHDPPPPPPAPPDAFLITNVLPFLHK